MTVDQTSPAADAGGSFPFLDRLEAIFALPITPEDKAAELRTLLPDDDADKEEAALRALDAAPPLTPEGESIAADAAHDFLWNTDAADLARYVGNVTQNAEFLTQFGELVCRQPEAQRRRLVNRLSNLLTEIENVRWLLTDPEREALIVCMLFAPEASP